MVDTLRRKAFLPICRAIGLRSDAWPEVNQIYYARSQRSKLEPSFIPYFNKENLHPEWREYHVFRTEYNQGSCAHGLTGFVSWKFGDKTGVSGTRFCEWIQTNPGYDVYFVNPFPHELRFKSVWEQGDACHPGITSIAQSLFDRVRYQTDLASLVMDETTTAYSNFWVGTPVFWRKYMEFCEPLYHLIMYGVSEEERRRLFSRADRIIDSSYVPFIFERLFSTLLTTQSDIASLRMPLEKDEGERPQERDRGSVSVEVASESGIQPSVPTQNESLTKTEKTRCSRWPSAHVSPSTFDIEPEPFHHRDQRWVIVAHWDEDGIIDDHIKYALRAYRKCAAKLTLVSTACSRLPKDCENVVDSFHYRENTGYDFASWRHALRAESLPDWCEQVVFVNSSVYGPVFDLESCFFRQEIAGAHLWGMTISAEHERHLQSYFMAMSRNVLLSRAGRNLWDGIKPYKRQRQVIDAYELRLLRHVQQSGFTVRALFDASQQRPVNLKERIRNLLRGPQSRRRLYCRSCRAATQNPSHMHWRDMLLAWIPYVKVELLRDNPYGLDTRRVLDHLEQRTDYPIELIRNHLRRVVEKKR